MKPNSKRDYDYGKCHVCRERMQEKRINQAFWVRSPRVSKGANRLVVIESVPGGVCPQCGEKVVRGDVGRHLASLIQNLKRLPKRKTISVPVVRYAKEVA